MEFEGSRMKVVDEATKQRLIDEYGAKGVETGTRLQSGFFVDHMAFFASLDADYTQAWVDWVYEYMYNRGILDDRTRVLCIIAECTVLDEQYNLPNHIRTALRVGARPEEILEVILQACVYAGMPRMTKALKLFNQVMEEDGLLDQLPARDRKRHEHLWPPQRWRQE